MNPIILLIVGAVGLAGCVILLLLGMNMLREERGKDGAPAGSSAGSPTPAAAAGLGTAEPDARPAAANSSTSVGSAFAGVTARLASAAPRGNAHEVLRVLRDNLTGRLVLEIAGKRYASLDELDDAEVRRALMTNLS